MRTTAGSLIAASALAVPALLGGGVASAEVAPHIVGGTAATGNTGWMASLQYNAPERGRFAQHTCGGTLVFRSWIVTNGHCVTDQPGNTTSIPVADKQFFVRVGSKDRTRGGETAKIIKIVVHPGWNWNQDPSEPADDIAMLQLDHAVDVQPLQLAGQPAEPGQKVQLYGWGLDEPDTAGDLPRRLQQLDTTVLPAADCAEAGQTAKEICTDNPHHTDGPAPGDSGGPAVAVIDGVPQLVGGASRAGAQYAGVAPTVYTSTPAFRQWIYDTARGVPAAA